MAQTSKPRPHTPAKKGEVGIREKLGIGEMVQGPNSGTLTHKVCISPLNYNLVPERTILSSGLHAPPCVTLGFSSSVGIETGLVYIASEDRVPRAQGSSWHVPLAQLSSFSHLLTTRTERPQVHPVTMQATQTKWRLLICVRVHPSVQKHLTPDESCPLVL